MFLRSEGQLSNVFLKPAVNSVPASSAVERNSSNALSCVILRNFTQLGSLGLSVVCYRQSIAIREVDTFGNFPLFAFSRAFCAVFTLSLINVRPSPAFDFDLGRPFLSILASIIRRYHRRTGTGRRMSLFPNWDGLSHFFFNTLPPSRPNPETNPII
jgi:hypothetical protein